MRKFERISLKKGEEKTIQFTLNLEKDFRYYDPMCKGYTVKPGDFEIQIGASSSDIQLLETINIE